MSDERELTNLRAEVARMEGRGRGRAYPAALEIRRAEGPSLARIGVELGICVSTLLRAAAFERVLVVEDAAPASALVVHGPCGLRIEGQERVRSRCDAPSVSAKRTSPKADTSRSCRFPDELHAELIVREPFEKNRIVAPNAQGR
jgi:hypothetical protein